MSPAARLPIFVVIVDDHLAVAEALSAAISLEPDMSVVGTVGSAATALERIRALGPDVVLMDVELGDGSGIDVTRAVHAEHPHVAVVMLTTHHTDTVLRSSIEAGCSGFIGKHEPMDTILGAVRAAAAGESVISPTLLARVLRGIEGPADAESSAPVLTRREAEVLGLLAEGASTEEVAGQLYLSVKTVRNYVQSALGKLGARSRLEAVAIATRAGILPRR